MKISDITAEMVIDAYRKTGLKPAEGAFYRKKQEEACALGVLALSRNASLLGMEDDLELNMVTEVMGWGVTRSAERDAIFGFMNGFDCSFASIPEIVAGRSVEFEQGRSIGRTVQEAFLKAAIDLRASMPSTD